MMWHFGNGSLMRLSGAGNFARTFLFLGILVGLVNSMDVALAAAPEAEHAEEHGEDHEPGESGEHGDEQREEGVVALSESALLATGLQIEKVERSLFRRLIHTTGELKLHPDRVARVGPRIDGRILKLLAQEGDRVRAKQVLASLISVELGEAKAEFLARKARLDLSKSNYKRSEGLRKKGISSEKDLLEAEAEKIKAEVEVASAETRLHVLGLTEDEIKSLKNQGHEIAGFSIRSPIAGQVIERPVALGQMAEPMTTLFLIADTSVLWAQLNVYERDLAAVAVGSKVVITLDAFPEDPVEGTITYLSALVDEATRAARARVVVSNADGRLRPGMFFTAAIEGAGPENRLVLTVPEGAVQRLGKRFIVFVPEGGKGRFRRHFVEVGSHSGGEVEIIEGLEAGMLVVAEGSFVLKSELSKEEMGGGHSH